VVVEVTSWGTPLTVRSNKKIALKASVQDYPFCVTPNPQQGTTAWAGVDLTLTAEKASLLDSGFDRLHIGMLRRVAK
jgi:hypothetical protein